MQVLIVGSGGREHALAWTLSQSAAVSQIYCAPGNAGLRQVPRCQVLPLAATDLEGLVRFATVQNIGLTVVGPEVPLAQGISDRFQAAGLVVFGPTQAGAQIESSKSWAKELMQSSGIPTAKSCSFTALEPALDYLQAHPLPLVVKADGLAAGKGVTVAATLEEATTAVTTLLGGSLGEAGKTLVIEEFLPGEEVSLLAFTDGKICLPLLPVQDHKRIGEGDTGPNTGGMGAYTPADHLVTPPIMERIQHRILDPTLVALQQRGIAYVGILYAGLMISPAGDPYVVEFNCRFGDPETQVLLPLLKTPLDQVMLACATGRLAQIQLEWQPGHAACVVMACRGYPDHYERGNRISGLDQAAATGALVFHAGTRSAGAGSPHECVTDGGRVLCITGRGESLSLALEQAYAAVRSIHFDGAYYRSDIGFKALKKEAAGS